MESIAMRIVARLLQHHGIVFAFIGEIALNYYNVPRVRHDIEICVPKPALRAAVVALVATGLFEENAMSSFNLYTEYKRGMPRLKTSGWLEPPQALCLFPDDFLYLEPLESSLIAAQELGKPCHISQHVLDATGPGEFNAHAVPIPRLQPLLLGFARRYLEHNDDTAMIAAEQLVDGMDVDISWCDAHLSGADQATVSLVKRLVLGRHDRIDDFCENKTTCFVKDAEESKRLHTIAGYN